MPENKNPDAVSKKGHSRLKFWTHSNKSSSDLIIQPMNDAKPSEKEKPQFKRIQAQEPGDKKFARGTNDQVVKKISFQKNQMHPPDSSKTTITQPQWIRPRSLGSTQVANQPINLPFKDSLKIMKEVIIKIKNSSHEPNEKVERKIEISVPEEVTKERDPISVEEPELIQEIIVSESDDAHDEINGINEIELDQTDLEEDANTEKLMDVTEIREQSGEANADLYTEAVNLYRFGLAGDKEAAARAYDLLKIVHQKDPENHLAEAYLGSATSLLGRDVADSNERFKYAIQGLKILDKVVALEPENIEIRGLRAFLCCKLPEQYFHRNETAIEDFAYLVSRYEEDDCLFTKDFFCQLLFELGLAYNRLSRKKESESTCRKLLSLTDDPRYEALIKQEGILISEKANGKKQLERGFAVKGEWNKAKYDEKLQEAISLHHRALFNSKPTIEKAFEIFKQAHKRNPQDPLIRAYYADCLAIMGLNSSDTAVMFRHTTYAIKNLDQAVNESPDNLTIRFLRGYNSYRIPEAFFKRTLTAIRDFDYLIQRYEQDPSSFDEETYWQLLCDLGHSYERLELKEEAKVAWIKLSQFGDSKFKTLVDEILKEGSDLGLAQIGPNSSFDELLKEGQRLYDFAIAGNKQVGLKAQELLQRACFADPLSALAEGYYGSSLAVTGRNSTNPQEMFQGFFKGLNHLKKAVARDPNNPQLHLLLADLFHNLSPSFFPSGDKAIKEFKFLKMAYEKDNSIFPEEVYFQVLYDLGVCYQSAGEPEKAQKVWFKLSKITADPKFEVLSDLEKEGDTEMNAIDKVREKYKEIAEELASEKSQKRSGRKEKRSKEKSKRGSEDRVKELSKQETEKLHKKSKRKDRKNVSEKAKEMPVERKRRREKEKTKDNPSEEKPVRKEKKRDRKKAIEKVQEILAETSSRRDKKRPKDEKPGEKPSRKERRRSREKAVEKANETPVGKTKRRDKKKRTQEEQPEVKPSRKEKKRNRENVIERLKEMVIKKDKEAKKSPTELAIETSHEEQDQ